RPGPSAFRACCRERKQSYIRAPHPAGSASLLVGTAPPFRLVVPGPAGASTLPVRQVSPAPRDTPSATAFARCLDDGPQVTRPDSLRVTEEVGSLLGPVRQVRPRGTRGLLRVAGLTGGDEVPFRVVA